ncbi:MAG: hypothetical protein JWL62_3361 [Hyphomicrobiales bacterium]|nr:hypothetical protein [Hyphomicrobiales bacterium]
MTMLRILIVEDEFLIALDLEDLLTEFGYSVCGIASSADDAEQMAGELKPDLILTDIQLARGSSGIEAARSIQARFHIPSVFLSAQAEECTQAEIAPMSLGCLQKPCLPSKLRSTLADAARHVSRVA